MVRFEMLENLERKAKKESKNKFISFYTTALNRPYQEHKMSRLSSHRAAVKINFRKSNATVYIASNLDY